MHTYLYNFKLGGSEVHSNDIMRRRIISISLSNLFLRICILSSNLEN
jgi:hypothetical protein